MGQLTVTQTGIDGLVVIEPKVFGDERGYFVETWNRRDFSEIGLDVDFVQDNQSMSRKGVLRGLHYQRNNPQSKLVRVVHGEVFDVAVDIRRDSPTFGEWRGVTLSAENMKMFYVPEGFAHGFLVLSPTAVFAYKCSNFYDPASESGIIWNDKTIEIEWPIPADTKIIISDKDQQLGAFDAIGELP